MLGDPDRYPNIIEAIVDDIIINKIDDLLNIFC